MASSPQSPSRQNSMALGRVNSFHKLANSIHKRLSRKLSNIFSGTPNSSNKESMLIRESDADVEIVYVEEDEDKTTPEESKEVMSWQKQFILQTTEELQQQLKQDFLKGEDKKKPATPAPKQTSVSASNTPRRQSINGSTSKSPRSEPQRKSPRSTKIEKRKSVATMGARKQSVGEKMKNFFSKITRKIV